MATAQGIISVVTANMARAIRVISRAARPRSARLHAGGVRRRRAAACRAACPGAGDRPHPGAAQSRHPVRDGPAADRPARRFRDDAAACAVDSGARPIVADAFAGTARACAARGSSTRASRRCRPADHAHGRYALCRAELRARRAGARRADHAGDARCAGRRASPPRTGACTASSPRASRCSSSPSALEAAGMVRKGRASRRSRDAGPDAHAAIIGRREVWLPEARRLRRPVRSTIATRWRPGNRIAGPAIVEQMDATTLVLPGMTARVDPYAQPDPGGHERHPLATHRPITVEVIGSALSLDRRGDGRGADPRLAIRPTSRNGATARRRCSTSPARRSARPSTSRCISAASSA